MLNPTRSLLSIAMILTFIVILMGAYTRLKDAGLGCPDWPFCYGQVIAPSNSDSIALAETQFPGTKVESSKAWIEMIHRYLASTLGLLIVVILAFQFRSKEQNPQRTLACALLGLVIFQGMLGMWTVTLKLLPVVVMSHLLGGLTTLCLLWVFLLKVSNVEKIRSSLAISRFAKLATLCVILQIALGGWTSANYAALICPDFPMCQAQWWPEMDFKQGFNLWGASTLNSPLEYMSSNSLTAIHVIHRLGALITATVLIIFIWMLYKSQSLAKLSVVVFTLLCLQITLGITNVMAHLPLGVAVSHNGVAVLLLLSLIFCSFKLQSR